MVGRKSIQLSEKEVTEAIRSYPLLKDAAKACNVSYPTFLKWKEHYGLDPRKIEQTERIREFEKIDWTEEDFEESENKYHVRRCFELMYRNILDTGRANTGTIEYMQQYGIHPQVGYVEIQGYMAVVNEMLSEGKIPHANHLEEFLDSLANKYYSESSKTINRIYGKENIIDKNIFTPTDN